MRATRTKPFIVGAISALLLPSPSAAAGCTGASLVDGQWHGTAYADVIDCRSVTDYVTVVGKGGDDVIHAGPGGGVFHGDGGADTIYGGSGPDRVFADNDIDPEGADVVYGSGGDDPELNGGGGNDVINGGSGNDELLGGQGDDTLRPGTGNDWVFADFGAFDGWRPPGYVDGTADLLDLGAATGGVTVDLERGTVSGLGTDNVIDVERVYGSEYGDSISGDANANELRARGGRDTVRGRGGNDVLGGGSGVDTLEGGAGTDTCFDGERLRSCEF